MIRIAQLVKLSGDVQMVGDGENRLYSDSLTIDMGSRDISINGIFLGGDGNLWIDASRAEKVWKSLSVNGIGKKYLSLVN